MKKLNAPIQAVSPNVLALNAETNQNFNPSTYTTCSNYNPALGDCLALGNGCIRSYPSNYGMYIYCELY